MKKLRKLPDDFSIPDEYLVEIGQISVLWSGLENHLVMALSRLSGAALTFDARVAALTLHSSTPQKIDALASLCNMIAKSDGEIKKYKEKISIVRQAQSARNRIIHASYVYDKEKSKLEMAVMNSRGKFEFVKSHVKKSELHEVCCKIHEASIAIHFLMTGHEVAPIWDRNPEEENIKIKFE